MQFWQVGRGNWEQDPVADKLVGISVYVGLKPKSTKMLILVFSVPRYLDWKFVDMKLISAKIRYHGHVESKDSHLIGTYVN